MTQALKNVRVKSTLSEIPLRDNMIRYAFIKRYNVIPLATILIYSLLHCSFPKPIYSIVNRSIDDINIELEFEKPDTARRIYDLATTEHQTDSAPKWRIGPIDEYESYFLGIFRNHDLNFKRPARPMLILQGEKLVIKLPRKSVFLIGIRTIVYDLPNELSVSIRAVRTMKIGSEKDNIQLSGAMVTAGFKSVGDNILELSYPPY